MEFKADANFVVVKLEHGENLFKELGNVIIHAGISSGMIVSGIGMLKDVELGYYNGKNYISKKFEKSMELAGLHGSIAENTFHIHCSIADNKHRVYGGHLSKAQVSTVCEILILKLENIKLKRVLDKKTRLKILKIG